MLDVLLGAADRTPDQVIVHVREDGTERTVSFGQLRDESLRVAGGYRAAAVAPGAPALLLADAGEDFQPMFWGALAAGLVPVPLPPEPHRVRTVRELLPDAVVVTDDASATVAAGLPAPVLRLAALRTGTPPDRLPTPAGHDVAFLQFSSGSTGAPRGVELTHDNVLANLEQARRASGAQPDDVLVTWMPYFHDMGLIGTHLTPLAIGLKQVRIGPLAFAKRPELWLTTAHRHRATLLSAANFALALAVRRIPADTVARLDLSAVRCMVVGAEPISAAVWRRFLAHTRPARLDPTALRPVYGLAEATLAVTFPPPGEVAAPVVLDRAELSRGRAVPTDPGPHAVEVMDLGHPVDGCALRIVDDAGRPLAEQRVGQIEVRGPNVARGYHRAPQASRDTFVAGWLRTGDLGFLRDGRLCVTGRAKDVVFVNGRTFHAADLEAVAVATPGLPNELAAVVGASDPGSGGERILVFVPWARPPQHAAEVLAAVRARVAEACGHDDVRVLPLPPGTFARTTSGKLRRGRMRDRYLAGDFADRERRWCSPAADATGPRRPPVADPAGLRLPPVVAVGRSRRDLEALIRQVWARVLDRPPASIGPDDRFLSIGGSSLKAMEVLAGLEDALGTTLHPADLRDCATVTALADRLYAGPPSRPTPPPDPTPRPDPARGRHTDETPDPAPDGPTIAVIGMACRFPGADTPEQFWQQLVDGVDAVGPVPAHRFTPTAGRTRWGSFLDDPMLFDAGFFGLTEQEARLTDPHARLFLELGHEALERAGYAGPRRHGRRVGVFAAVGESAYPELLTEAQTGPAPADGAAALVGNLRNLVPARLAQALDLTGPVLAVDTACSSALVALHLATRSLAAGECDVAVVGGVNLNLTETGYRLLDAAAALSPTGRCRAFDAAADGFVPGEGGAVLVLRRGDHAHADGDPVLALVAGTAVGNDGRSLSLLAPNPHRQWEVIARAYRDAGVDPAQVSYVEAHGTGTELGDPVEVRSLAAAYPPPADGVPRGLGSVKTNLGHLLNSAGLPALVKVVLALRHRYLPPVLHHTRTSTRFDLEAAGFAVVTEGRAWAASGPLVAGVNGFGFGGTNAHAILREAPADPPATDAPPPSHHLATLTARSADALRQAARELAAHLRGHPELAEADVCASAGTARDDAPYRLAVVAAGDLARRLDVAADTLGTAPIGRRPRSVFVFPDHDAMLPAAAVRDLHDRLPVFRNLLVAADTPVAGRALLSWCLRGDRSDPQVAAPVAVAVGIALAGQLAAWGVRPDAALGNGVGELVAAVARGELAPAEAVRRAGATDRPAGPTWQETRERLRHEGYDTVVDLGIGRLVAALRADGPDPVRVLPLSDAGEQSGTTGLLAAVGRLWALGGPLDRVALHAGRRRVPVPTYPWQRRSYPPPSAAPVTGSPHPTVGPPHRETLPLHRVAWREAPVDGGGLPARVRLCGPGLGGELATRLAATLTGRGVAVETGVEPADDLGTPQVTVLLAGPAVDPPDVAALDTALAAQVHALRAVLDEPDGRLGRLLVSTEDVQVTGAAERPRPVQAVLTGLCLALADERPALRARVVDLSAVDSVAVRVESLCRELCGLGPTTTPAAGSGAAGSTPAAGSTGAGAIPAVGSADGPALAGIAWRAGRRLGRHLVPVPERAGHPDAARAVRPDGVHVIVGGGGAIGAELARFLAHQGRPTLLLAGRSDQAPDGLLAELAAAGATARYQQCDVTVPAEVDALLAGVDRVDTVWHAAGRVRLGSLAAKSGTDVLAVLAPKVHGSQLLAQALRRHGHDEAALVGFSSVSAVAPGLAGALGDYAAANAYLDSFATAQRAVGRPVQSVGFAAVTGTGMAADTTARGSVGAVTVHAGLRALLAARQVDAAHLVVADLDTLHPSGPTHAPTEPAAAPALPRAATPAHPRAAEAAVGRSVRGGPEAEELAGLLRRLLAEPLHRPSEEIADDISFLTLGLDSLAAVDLVKRLEDELDRQLPVTLFFEYTTVATLAAYLARSGGAPAAASGPAPSTPVAGAPPTGAPALGDGVPFPLTPAQRAWYVNGRLHPTVAGYAFVRQTVSGPLDPELLGRALAGLAARHPMLRVRFAPTTGTDTPRQVVLPTAHDAIGFEVRPLSGALAALTEELCNTPVDLTRQPPLRAVLVQDGPDRSHLLLVVHHAAADGFSLNLLSEELWTDYTALARGRTPASRAAADGFAGYARTAAAGTTADLTFWRQRFDDPGWTLRLPYDGDPAGLPAPPNVTYLDELDDALVAGLRQRAAEAGVSLFHLLLAGYLRCLARWSGQPRVPVNVARAGRDARLPGIERIVGPFADTLPLLVEVDPAESADRLADRLRRSWSEAQRHGSVSSLDLARLLRRGGDGPRTASPAGFSFARFPVTVDPDCPVTVVPAAAGSGSAATQLSLLCWESGTTLRLSWNFPLRLFERATVARLAAEHHRELADLAAGRPVETAAGQSGRSAAGRRTPQRVGSAGTDVTARIRAVCRRAPDVVAVRADDRTVTYRELDRAADAVAALLVAHGVRPGQHVGMLTAPGPDSVVAVVGILRAGAAWVPLDAAHPPARLADQLRRAGAEVVLHDGAGAAAVDRLSGAARPVRLGTDAPELPTGVPAAAPEDTAYVIFTSGSTGRPKGVPVTHRAMTNYLDWAVDTFGYRPGDRLAQTSSICFDASVRQILAPLLVGATVVTFPRPVLRDPQALLSRIAAERLTVWSSVPTLWERLLRAAEERTTRDGTPPDLSALRWVHVGGEELSPVPVRRWFDLFGDGCRITNLYGPTEATINASWHLIDARPDDAVHRLPIGRPVGGARVCVVDPDGNPCPPGVAGELYLGGVGITDGYLGEPELTAAAFVQHDGERYYRSGDLGRVNPDGSLDFLGRLDDQVKIHGYRLEPGEIEAVLRTHPAVTAATVLHQAEPHPRLHAFVMPAPDTGPTVAQLRGFLAERLPEQLVPARIHLLDRLPLTPTGKVDRDGLRAHAGFAPAAAHPASAVAADHPPAPASSGSGSGSGSGSEGRLARIWAELLDLPAVAADDDFFALGGDSILALEVFARAQQQFPAVPSPAVIYQHRTLRELAAAIDAAAGSAVADSTGTDRTGVDPDRAGDAAGNGADRHPAAPDPGGPFPVTATQRGFLLADAVAPGAGTAWLARLRLRGPLRRELLQQAVDLLVARHPMLRTVFPAGVRPPVQQELPASLRLPVGYEKLTHPTELAARVAEERQRPFEPWAWPLLRLRLLAVGPDDHVLLVHAHHLIGDGYSAALLGQELLAGYHRLAAGAADELPALRTHFRDYVALLARRTAGPPEPDAHSWWTERFAIPYRPPVLRRRDGVPATDVAVRGFTLDASAVGGLRRLAAAATTTLYATVLTAYHRAVARLTGQDDLVLGLALTGRDHPLPDLHRVFGPCAAMLPLRLSGSPDFAAQLARVAAEVAAARRYDDPPSIAATVPVGAAGAPAGAQFFFSFLDFAGLGAATAAPVDNRSTAPAGPPPAEVVDADRLTLSWDAESELTPPPLGTDLFLTARPGPDGLRVTLRGAPGALTPAELDRVAQWLRTDLTEAAATAAGPHRGARRTRLAAAIVGYLPAPAQLAEIAGLPAGSLPREQVRELLFPAGRPRLLEELTTPLGVSGFVCLPRFADELAAAGEALAIEAGAAVDLAADLGARCVSLAGMIPARTGYGLGVLRGTRSGVAVSTGHAATVVSVVRTVEAALSAAGRDLAGQSLAVVGLGSIGLSSLRLLLARAARPPARLVLCDVPAAAPRLAAQADRLRADGFAGTIEVCPSAPGIAAAGYTAQLVIAATGAATEPIEVDRLAPGTIVVDDSFPPAVDPVRSLARMRRDRDILVTGGGLLQVGRTRREIPAGLPPVVGHEAVLGLPGTIASCRLESLLWTVVPDLPLVHGLVDDATAAAYARAIAGAGVGAAPLHLRHHLIDPDLPGTLPG
ncbi:amino acid adenylation domain-containing protein [Micromonospora radicis]|uniref:Amino acid adenylation domain-containing protein n=1 Tax=Micromonospora radicis TaxID=1894971 RepID=A0A418MZJ7_9ACTN|nr:amino acid adenylation domain-containing protein [Micromonospora radicis]